MDVTREDAGFKSHGTRCAAWLYRPDGGETTAAPDPPVVVMAHGFGATRRMRLPEYAERFAARGIAVLVFDYRGFGDSGGTPRNVVDPDRHLDDWRAAVDHARALPAVDGDRLGVWGTSFSGGHALVMAAEAQADAYVGQMPYFGDAPSVLTLVRRQGVRYVGRTLAAALRDLLRARTFRSPYYIPIVGQPGELAPLNAPGAESGYRSIVPDDLEEAAWNRCAARIMLLAGRYEPHRHASDVECPAFILQASQDNLVSSDAIDRVVETLDDVEHVRVDCGHFEPYTGEIFERSVSRQAEFLDQHLCE